MDTWTGFDVNGESFALKNMSSLPDFCNILTQSIVGVMIQACMVGVIFR